MFLPAPPAWGARLKDLYEAEVPIAGRSAQAQGIQTALRLVLVKLTGDRNAAGRPALKRLIENPEALVQQYGYRGSEGGPEGSLLWVKFDPEALERGLAQSGVPIWGRERPAVLLWLGVEEGGRRRVLGRDDPSPYRETLNAHARWRGLPLVLPLLDTTDETWSEVIDPSLPMSEPIAAALRRYGADAVLAGHLVGISPALWQAEWTLFGEGRQGSWSSQGDLPEVALDEGLDRAVDTLMAYFAAPTDRLEEEPIAVVVEGIEDLDHYARTERYLRSLDPVRRVEVKKLGPGRVEFGLKARGGVEAVNRAITLGTTLQALDTGTESGHYQLLSR
jgi:hypothetical protein